MYSHTRTAPMLYHLCNKLREWIINEGMHHCVLTDLEGYNREYKMLYSLFVFLFNTSKSELVYLNPVLQNISPEFDIK